jgi:DNA-binding transcriptional LysR family regulator
MPLAFNLNNVITFLAVAKTCSFRQAAEEIHTSQSAVSSRIRQLEERLGVRLFHRTTRSVRLTDEGMQLFIVAKSAIDDMERVAESLRKKAALQNGELTVASVPSVGQTMLPTIMGEFHRRHPGVILRLLDVDSQRCIDMMEMGTVDLAIVSDLEDRRNIIFEELFWDECFLVVPCNHVLAERQSISLKETAGYPLMLSPKGTTLWQIIERAFLSCGLTLAAHQQTWNMSTLVRLVEEGFGIGIVPEICLGKLDVSKCAVLTLQEHVGRMIGVARMTNRAESPSSVAFRHLLYEKTPSAPTLRASRK